MNTLNSRIKLDKKINFGVFDFETTRIDIGEQKFIIGGIYFNNHYEVFDSISEIISFFIRYGENIPFFAHNLSYDVRFLFDELNNRFLLDFIFSNSKLIKLTARDRKTKKRLFVLRDSYSLLPYSLHYLSKTFNVKHKKQKIDFENEEFNPNNDTHLKYLRYDCLSLHEILTEFFKRFSVDLNRLTISSISYNKWKDSYSNKSQIFVYPSSYSYLRSAYYGGRVEVFNLFLEDGFYFDINSSYPNEMRNNKYPIGEYIRVEDRDFNTLGLYFCNVSAPEDLHIPFLPYRKNKLFFPLGFFSGWYTSPEIDKAISLGYEISIKFGFEWFDSDYIFRDYIDNYYKLKEDAELKNDKCLYAITKLFLNSLSGKFGQKQYKEVIRRMTFDEKKQFFNDNPDGSLKTFFSDYVFSESKFFEKNYAPQISAFITSYGRISLYEFFELVGFENVYYSDTDSLFTTSLLPTSKKLGGLSLEDEIKQAVFLAPKTYAYVTPENKTVVKSKGFNSKNYSYNDYFNALFNKKIISDRRIIPTSIKMCNFRDYGITTCYSLTKDYIYEENKINFKRIINDDYSTSPFVINKNEKQRTYNMWDSC